MTRWRRGSTMLEVSPVRAFSDNYLWLIRAPGDRVGAVVVDPGEARPVEAALEQHGLKLRAILVTHHHLDHVGGSRGTRRKARGSGLRTGPRADALRSSDTRRRRHSQPCDLGLEFRVMAVPGHTLGHIAYHGHGALFCGDTLFSGGCGRLFEGTPAQMHQSLDRIAALPDSTRDLLRPRVHAWQPALRRGRRARQRRRAARRSRPCANCRERDGITLPSTLGRERKHQSVPALPRARRPRRGRGARRPTAARDAVETFAMVRAWKDGFR